MTARLTVGIPTYNRPHLLGRAIEHAIRQTVPVEIVVTDNGTREQENREAIAEVLDRHRDFGEPVRYVRSSATCLWGNWDACARACETEFFMWLQDDDVIQEHTAARVVSAFDRFPEADTWMAPNKLALDDRYIWWNNGNGPWVPLDRKGVPDQWEGEVLAPTSYFLSWSLSPGVAFRARKDGRLNPAFLGALDGMPHDCAIFAERLILVLMGGRFVADPYIAGLWIQHPENENRKLHDDQPRQSTILIEHLDRAMDRLGDRWESVLALWCKLQHPNWIVGWLGDLEHVQREGGASRYGEAIQRVMIQSLDGRVRYVPRYRWWRRALNWVARRAAA